MCIDGASWRMAKFPVPRESLKKKTSSLIPLIHVDVRENGTESSVKDARVQLTRENWPKETRYANRPPIEPLSRAERERGRAENGRRKKERKTREGVMERERKRYYTELEAGMRRGEEEDTKRNGWRIEREEEKSRRVGVSSLVGTSYSFILKRPRKIASTVETVLFLLHT